MNSARSRSIDPLRPLRTDVRVRLIALMLLLALIPTIGLSLLGRNSLQSALVGAEERTLNSSHDAATNALDNFLRSTLTLVEFTSRAEPVVRYANGDGFGRTTFTTAAQDQFRRLIKLNPRFESMALADPSGQIILEETALGQASGLGTDISAGEYFQAAAAGQPFIAVPAVSIASKQGAFVISTPVFNPNQTGQVAGVVRLRISDAALGDVLNGSMAGVDGRNAAIRLTLLDRDGIVISQTGRGMTLEGSRLLLESYLPLDAARLEAIKRSRRFGTEDLAITQLPVGGGLRDAIKTGRASENLDYALGGEHYIASISPIAATGWLLIGDRPQAAILAPVNAQTLRFLLFGLLIAAFAAGAAFIIARQIAGPVEQMGRVAQRIAGGDYSSRMPEAGEDQFAELGRTVNTMVEQIVTNTREQEAQNTALQSQIVQLLEEVSTVAEGDLTVEAEVSDSALGAVADSFNYMITELRQVIGRVNMATHQVSNSTDEILTTTDTLSRSAEQQASRIADTSTAIEEMAVSIQQVSENAAVSAQVAREARIAAGAGSQAVTATVEGMVRIRQQVQETSKKIKRLGESSQEIGQAVQLIEEIAKRTNRLALNAAIQAAMAGEHGKGFAVVAEEVRRLAERTSAATGQIAELVGSIQSETAGAVIAMEDGTREVVGGSRLADDAGRSLDSIDQIVGQLAELIEAISLAADQQARASAGIARAMSELSSVTQGTAVGSQQAAASVASLATLADDLRESVATFRLEPGQAASATAGHNGQGHDLAAASGQLVAAGQYGRN